MNLTPPSDSFKSIKSMLLGFEEETRTIPIDSIIPTKILKPETKLSAKYRQIVSSIAAVGVIEMPVVVVNRDHPDTYFLLDGLLRIEAIKDRDETEIECLVAKDDEAYTYNKCLNRLAAVQEHKMIVCAIERGASAEQIAIALNVNPASIRQRSHLLDGICHEASMKRPR